MSADGDGGISGARFGRVGECVRDDVRDVARDDERDERRERVPASHAIFFAEIFNNTKKKSIFK